jgi:selenocysteine lyase/cysteine desulfurase
VDVTRRELLAGLGGVAASAVMTKLGAQLPRENTADFPRKQDFAIAEGYTYINGAFTHPMPIAAGDAYRAVVDRRSRLGPPAPAAAAPGQGTRVDARTAFASLINAKPSEIAYIQNTSSGENLVIEALGLDKPFDGNIVTDELHFEGALLHLMELKRHGADIRVVKQKEGRVDMKDMERLVDRKTKLVEVSFVAMYNGFQHDLKAVCDLAHAHGAYVYADIIQGVGAVPLDVRATGLDFAASATYKWLMGDFGFAFFYVREGLLGTVVQRPHWSYASAPDTDMHLSPFDPEYPKPVTYTPGKEASHYVQLGTTASAIAAALAVSIPYIQGLGVANIEKHRTPLIRRLQQELPRFGFTPQTPAESTSPVLTFAMKDTRAIGQKLNAARVSVRVAPHWVRISPSVYNDMADVERLLEALA